ncbi:cytochrome P450 [Bombardia bombarda]|uniref:Cytochrome P450 n=1 Tax=Bombardia bombarda TaxID=252184 RepID=A0AA39TW56_9PEZI|nr:cytochrome P450 [Bombardia bombarda]
MDCVKVFNQSIGASIVDWFPALADLPRWLQPWRAHWERLDRWNYNVYRSWWVPAREKVMNGTAPPSFVRDTLLHSDTRFTGDDDDAMYVAMQLIEAGSGTTTESLNIMVMAALERPEAFVRARQEVDRVCGAGSEARLPVLGDMESLGYICAMAKELLRWRPIFAVFPDHVSLKDIEFEGYRFPAGTSFVINQTVVGDECEDPERFMPERWLGDGREADITHGMWQFGGGRRVCVGYRLAQRSLFINIARLVQCFDFEAVSCFFLFIEVLLKTR